VGSGDAFTAGFLFGLSNKKDKIYSIKLGMACSAANLMHYGSCFIKKNEIYQFLPKIQFTKY
jgi:fructose-1-phosphate kinase PfkB-like protein